MKETKRNIIKTREKKAARHMIFASRHIRKIARMLPEGTEARMYAESSGRQLYDASEDLKIVMKETKFL